MDIETQFFVQSFVRFLNQQIASTGFPTDIVESLEVATQCLETAYNLPVELPVSVDAAGSMAATSSTDPMTHVDVRELFRTACAGHPERKREADGVKNEGNRLMREEKFDEALISYNRAIALDPTNPVFYCNRAATFSRLGNFERAADDCRMSLRYEPRYSKAYGRLGIALSKLGLPEQAVQAYENALELEPQNVDYVNNLLVAQQQLQDQQGGAQQPDGANEPAASAQSFILPAGLESFQAVLDMPSVQQLVSDPQQLERMLRMANPGNDNDLMSVLAGNSPHFGTFMSILNGGRRAGGGGSGGGGGGGGGAGTSSGDSANNGENSSPRQP